MKLLLVALALCLAGPALASENAPWRSVDSETGKIRDVEGLEQLARDFPDSASVRLRMLQPLLAAGETEKLLETLRWLKDRGYVFSEVTQQQIPKLIGEQHADAARALLIPAPEIIEASEIIATVPAEVLLVEGVGRAADGTVIAGAILSSTIVSQDETGGWTPVVELEGDAFGPMVRLDSGSRFWASSGAPDMVTAKDDAFHGVILFDAMSRSVEHKLAAPQGGYPSDIAIGPDGSVYVSDPFSGAIYKGDGQGAELETFIPKGIFRSPQGLAVSADGSRLYVSDYRYGIAIVDLSNASFTRLAADTDVILDGVDGLWRHGNELIVVQNGTSPMRISAFQLSEDGFRVVGQRVLEQAHSGWTEPLGGSIDDDALIYVATGQWDRFLEGQPLQDKPPMPTQIRRLPLE